MSTVYVVNNDLVRLLMTPKPVMLLIMVAIVVAASGTVDRCPIDMIGAKSIEYSCIYALE